MPILLRSVYPPFRYREAPREFSPGALLYENAHRLSHRRLFMHKLHRSHLRWLVIFHPVVTATSKCNSSALSCGSETISQQMVGDHSPVRHGYIEVQLFRTFVRQRDHLATDGWQFFACSSRLHRSAALPHFRAAARPSTAVAIIYYRFANVKYNLLLLR